MNFRYISIALATKDIWIIVHGMHLASYINIYMANYQWTVLLPMKQG